MGDWLLLVGIGVVVFAATNVDDIFVLLGFFSDPTFHVRQVVFGQYVGIAALTLFSIALSLTALLVPPSYVGLLGLAPLGIGARMLFRREADPDTKTHPSPRANVFAVTAVTLANGGDNLRRLRASIRHPPSLGGRRSGCSLPRDDGRLVCRRTVPDSAHQTPVGHP